MIRILRAAAAATLVAAATAGCKDASGPRDAPLPVLASISPDTASTGRTGATFTVTGSEFSKKSVVQWNGTALATEYVSGTTLRATAAAAQLGVAGAASITVVTPAPGGGTSSALPFNVGNARPTVTALSADTVTVGQTSGQIVVTGTGFLPVSTVQWNGAPVAATYQSSTQLTVTLNAAGTPLGTLPLTVANPEPGGGTSDGVPVRVQAPLPVLALLPSRGAAAGRAGFTLALHGSSFLQGATVLWNGTARPAVFISPTRLTVDVNAADVAAQGNVTVAVANPGPVARTSSAITMSVRTPGAATATVQRVPIVARDLAWDAGTGRLYLSIPASGGTLGNTVAAVDPASGTVTGSVFVGSEPTRMARSSDGKYLYVGLNGASAVRRVELSPFAAGLQWSLPAGEVAGDLEVMPGQAGTVAVARNAPAFSPPLTGVTIYDDGVARATSSPGHTGGNRIEFLESASLLYGYNNSSSGFGFFTIGVDASGARHLAETGGLVGGYYTDILGASGRIYGTDGGVVDAERRVKVGTTGAGVAMAVDAATGRAFVLRDSFGGGGIAVYDLNNFQLLGTLSLPPSDFPHPALLATRLVRWGQDGLAFLDSDELFIVRSPLIAP